MTSPQNMDAIRQHWERVGLAKAILDELGTTGIDMNTLTMDDLEPFDQFHGGGKEMTLQLAREADLKSGMRVLDVGGGLGGPARTLAKEFGCKVTVVDLTESYLAAGRMLTQQLNLESKVQFIHDSALDLKFEDESFDVVWTQNSGMNIADKESLYAGFRRVLRPGGLLAIQEPMNGSVQPPHYPLMWARDASTNFLRTPVEMKRTIEFHGFKTRTWTDMTAILTELRNQTVYPLRGIQTLVMGDDLAEISAAIKRNTDEKRVVLMQGVFQG